MSEPYVNAQAAPVSKSIGNLKYLDRGKNSRSAVHFEKFAEDQTSATRDEDNESKRRAKRQARTVNARIQNFKAYKKAYSTSNFEAIPREVT